jgi:hypothetical protein
MRQLQLFTSKQMAAMRDRTKARNYSPGGEEFRREHKRHRDWGLAQRHAQKLRRLRDSNPDNHTLGTVEGHREWEAAQPRQSETPKPVHLASSRPKQGHHLRPAPESGSPKPGQPKLSATATDQAKQNRPERPGTEAEQLEQGRSEHSMAGTDQSEQSRNVRPGAQADQPEQSRSVFSLPDPDTPALSERCRPGSEAPRLVRFNRAPARQDRPDRPDRSPGVRRQADQIEPADQSGTAEQGRDTDHRQPPAQHEAADRPGPVDQLAATDWPKLAKQPEPTNHLKTKAVKLGVRVSRQHPA